ncbi:DUF3604 domain-containing protein [Holdemania filiformis]|uniref:DUF3604 domain-containing protein n=1 Tax=Holdemania filiformis TaxID=61171 RepID=UPI00267703E0|nr:DUF3604 domain-containing protein [Holdemania filiformis]
MDYKILWTDMHSNIHHEQMNELPQWFDQVQKMMDFWPIAYYPYTMRKDETGLGVEDRYPLDVIEKDWEALREFTEKVNAAGFPMFMGYEWQGAGQDGDHNVFCKDNRQKMEYPLRYADLVQAYAGKAVIGIPHHLAYQLENRGKNWTTHNETFSPFVEIYSSHGSSENDNGPIEMTRHVHMGPRTGETCVERGWEDGYKFGVIASGDNHSAPCVYGFGYMACLAEDNTKEAIWDAMQKRHTYGVSKDRIQVRMQVDGKLMGDVIEPNPEAKLTLDVIGSDAIDRIEVIEDNQVVEMIPHTSTWERKPLGETIRFKFKVEFGWGPDRRIFPDIASRSWKGALEVPGGKLLSIEKCWSNFGQDLHDVTDNRCEFDLTTYKTTATGKWMGPSAVTTEGFIFEVEADREGTVLLSVDGVEYPLAVKDLLKTSRVVELEEEARQLVKDRFNFTDYYRTDPWWHNAYKFKIGQAVVESGYHVQLERTLDLSDVKHLRLRIWERNGGCAWTSPVFVEKKGE